MNSCCLVDCHSGYISPLTMKSLLKRGINSSCRPGIQFGLAARWQDALKDQMLCYPQRVGQQKGRQPALGVVSVELLLARSSLYLLAAPDSLLRFAPIVAVASSQCDCMLVPMHLYPITHALCRNYIFKGIHNPVKSISLFLGFFFVSG